MQALFQKNLDLISSSNENLTPKDLCLDKIDAKIKKLRNLEITFNDWLQSKKDVILYPSMMARSTQTNEAFLQFSREYQLGSSVEQYIEKHGDPHFYGLMNELRQLVVDLGYDPNDQNSAISTNYSCLLLIGTGNGSCVQDIIRNVQPTHIAVCVTSWEDFASSFETIDWQSIWNQYNSDPLNHRLNLCRVKDYSEIIGSVVSSGLLFLDHTYVYKSPVADPDLQDLYSKAIDSDYICNLIWYLGYVADEYNMIYNTSHTLLRQPKIYNPSRIMSGTRCIVCASGPSLDNNLELIKTLQEDTLIIAAGSAISALSRFGIRVDITAQVEREMLLYDDFAGISNEIELDKKYFLMSSTCNHQLTELFKETLIFFRPALTPLALYSEKPTEILHFEAPESINAAVSFAASIGCSEIYLFGVDLGTKSKEYDRSREAVGFTPRTWEMEREGNFSKVVFTNKIMVDTANILAMAARAYALKNQTKFYNCSDGLKIDDYESLVPAKETIQQISLINQGSQSPHAKFEKYISSLKQYSKSRFDASWQSRDLRKNTFTLARSLRQRIEAAKDIRELVLNIDDLLDLANVPLPQQAPRRILRSLVYKGILAISQQFHILNKHNDIILNKKFEKQACATLCNNIFQIETEIYDLCDCIEKATNK